MTQKEIHLHALQSFTDSVADDPNVIALLLSGSLSYGTVWEKSDIDLTMLVRDGSIKSFSDYNIDSEGIEIHLRVETVGSFKETMQKHRGGEYIHSFFGKGKFVFTKDPSLPDLFEDAKVLGEDDIAISAIPIVDYLLVLSHRAEKWITVFHDPLYSQRFLIECAIQISDLVLLMHKEIHTRESILRAMELEPELMQKVYVKPITTAMTEDDVRETLVAIDGYIQKTMEVWKQPVLQYFSDTEVKTSSQFYTYMGTDAVITLDYMAEHGLLERITSESRLFKHSLLTVDEIAYLAIPPM